MDESSLVQFLQKISAGASLAVIIASPASNLPQVDIDLEHLVNTFKELGYNVCIVKDNKAGSIVDVVNTISANFNKEWGTLVVTYSGHGKRDENETLLDTGNGLVKLETQVVNPLVSKHPIVPKIFLIDACRGRLGDPQDPGEEYGSNEIATSFSHARGAAPEKKWRLPTGGNYLLAYATFQNRPAYETSKYGSWTQLLCQQIQQNAGEKSIFDLLGTVNENLIRHRKAEAYVQQPIFISCLNVMVRFPPSSARGGSGNILTYAPAKESSTMGASNILTYQSPKESRTVVDSGNPTATEPSSKIQSASSLSLPPMATKASSGASDSDYIVKALKREGVSIERLQESPDDFQLTEIAKVLGTEWEPIALKLDIEQTTIDDIIADKNKVTEQRVEVLKKWKQRFGFEATYERLLTALRDLKKNEIIDKVVNLLK